MYYFDVLEALYKDKIKYLIVGGLAVNLHGVPRVTQDIDLVISTDKENILKTISALQGLNYVPRMPVDPRDMADPEKVREWTEKRNMKAFSFYQRTDPFKVIDLLLVHSLDFESSYKNRTQRKVDSITIDIISMDDLIRMKEEVGREQDRSDVLMLKKVKAYGG
jgi:hypothetical protein